MSENNKPHAALYGSTALLRGYCADCESYAIVLDGELLCCDSPFTEAVSTIKRMSEPENRRGKPSSQAQRSIKKAQGNACLYCGREFGSFITFRNETVKVTLVWDHQLPLAFSLNNADSNFVAACSRCNAWKSDKVFQTLEEAQVYLATRWEAEALDG